MTSGEADVVDVHLLVFVAAGVARADSDADADAAADVEGPYLPAASDASVPTS